MDQTKPTGPDGTKEHVLPHVGVEDATGYKERDEDHAERVGNGAIECVEESRVDETVMGLMRDPRTLR